MSANASIVAELRAVIREEMARLVAPVPVALKRAAAAKLMGIGVTKLDALIKAGRVATAEDTHLIPMSEVKRYCAPKPKRRRKPAVGHRARAKLAEEQGDEAIADAKRAMRSAQ